MTVACSIKLSDEEKLDVLRRVDEFRQWHSLDEKRYCLAEQCNAMPMEWVPPTEEVLIKIAMMEAERRWLCYVKQAGRAMQSYQRKRTSNTINGTRPKPPLG
jgi:hypothetical protein